MSSNVPQPPSERSPSGAARGATPRLHALLRGLRARLTRQVWLHGLGSVAAVAALWLAFAFLADWGLRVPRVVRILHGLTLIALPAYIAWREILRPLAKVPDEAGLALLIERRHPELHELFVSAVQLQRKPDGDAELVARVFADAEARAADVTLAGVLEESGPRRRFAVGGVLFGAAALALITSPLHSGILFDRMLGRSTPWPQRTQLSLELPNVARITEVEPGRYEVKVARGTDVAVLVRANGVVPSEVALEFDGGGTTELARGGDNTFRTLLRNCQEDLAFSASGGDDLDGRPYVNVVVLQPPDVLGIAVHVDPPSYSGLPARTEWDRDIEVLAGSKLTVSMVPDPRDVRGVARVLPEDRLIELVPAPFPVQPGAAAPSGTADAPRGGFAFALEPLTSLRYRFELEDDQGLTNPDPGLFAVDVIEDRAPEIALITPRRSDVDTVLGGIVPVRARAEDDFGLTRVQLVTRLGAGDESVELERDLELRSGEDADGASAPSRSSEDAPLTRGFASARLEVDEVLKSAAPDATFRSFSLQLRAFDNRPTPGFGASNEVSVRIISPDELLRRIQDRLARARVQASDLADLQRSKRADVDDLLQTLKGDSLLLDEDTLALQTALSGQRRVLGDARSLSRELASIAETVVYARLDDKAGALLERLDRVLFESATDTGFQVDAWRSLGAALASGGLGSPGFAGHLVELVSLGLEIESDHAQASVAALDRAQNALSAGDVFTELSQAEELQGRALQRIEDLLERLAEWDNFQSVLLLTRDILNRQESLLDRTKRYASEK